MNIEKYQHPNKKYVFLKKLGDGSASTIFLSKCNDTGNKVIIKRINKKEEWKDELYILKQLKNLESTKILKFIEYFETERFIYIITEYYDGCDLFDHIDINVPYPENFGKLLIKEMSTCIKECHDNNLVHLDIKCENYMVKNMSPKPELILIDFGHAVKLKTDKLEKGCSSYGTSLYLCPEGYSKFFSKKSDIFSLGICAHLILCGDYPYEGNDSEYIKNVKSNKYWLNPKLSENSKIFIEWCINYDPDKRPTIEQVLESEFLGSIL